MYEVENPSKRAMTGMNQAAGTLSRMEKDIPANRDPGPSAGGLLGAGVQGAKAGHGLGGLLGATSGTAATAETAAVAGTTAMGMSIGALTGVGALVGIGAYLLS